MYKDKDILKRYRIKTIRKFKFIVPREETFDYQKNKKLLQDAGWNISVEYFLLIKWVLAIVVFVFLCSMQTTNITTELKRIYNDVNYSKILIDEFAENNKGNIEAERKIMSLVKSKIKIDKHFMEPKNKPIFEEYIKNIIMESGMKVERDTNVTVRRIYNKLQMSQKLENPLRSYVMYLLLSFVAFMAPTMIALFRGKLIESKKSWEILNLLNIFTIYGKLPPYDLKVVLQNMIVTSSIYKNILSELYENIKLNRGQAAFDEVMKKIDNSELYEILEVMKDASLQAGMKNAVDEAEQMVELNIKWLEVENIKRREVKTRIAMIPVGIIFLLAMMYFSLGMSVLSNPMYINLK